MGNLIVKDNALVEASHKLGEVEQRLILLAILKAREVGDTVEQLRGKELIIHAEDYSKTFGISQQMAYHALKKAVMGLYRAEWGYKYINDKGNKVVRYERFTQSAQYVEREGLVSFKFADAIIPMLVELERRFTSYEIEQVAQLSSQYAMRLYEFFMRHFDKKTGTGWLDISLDDLRFRFGLLPSEYKTMSNFKAYVLDFSLKQINEYTDLSATYEQRKKGRSIVGFKFSFKFKAREKEKEKPKNLEYRDPNTIDFMDSMTDKERSKGDDLTPRNDTEHQIIAEKKAYADQIGATELHRQNLIKQVLEQHRQAEQQDKDRADKERDERQAQEQQDKERLELAQRQFEQILASDELINAYIANNITARKLTGLQKIRYEQGDFKGVFEMDKYKFEQLHYLKQLNLEFLEA